MRRTRGAPRGQRPAQSVRTGAQEGPRGDAHIRGRHSLLSVDLSKGGQPTVSMCVRDGARSLMCDVVSVDVRRIIVITSSRDRESAATVGS